ncbi:actin-like ATPase domain-containing protein [Phellopilus nigrolimitatus]|nr:actin-like ATPase domain-containing protein [Phellopilus nigrolimitatus]
MPRGIPNAKKDDFGMRYTSFHVPLTANPKLTASNYLKNDSQTVWARNAARASKSRLAEDLSLVTPEGRRGAKVLVVHPGSRWLRVGRASDVVPVAVPHVIARRVRNPPATPPVPVRNIVRPRRRRGEPESADVRKEDEYSVTVASDDPVEGKIAAITTSLRDRMRFYKLRVVPNASRVATTFNEQMKGEETINPEIVMQDVPEDEILVGKRVFELSDPAHLDGYAVRWPIYAGRFNTRDYASHQNMLSDLEEIWRTVIRDTLKVEPKSFKEYSIVLVIPDLWDRFYVRELVNMLLISMGFKQVVCQQESLAATYGAGISNACVIDLGAVKTSVACVDDGLVLFDTRMSLSIGGDDVTEFLAILLDRISFPYEEMDLTRMHDWLIMEDLKRRICTLEESDVALNLYDFWVRHPHKHPVKYGLRAYDEVILAPMVIFEPRVVRFDQKREGLRPGSHPDVTDEVMEFVQDQLTHAMMISTQHLMPQATPVPLTSPPSISVSGAVTPQPIEAGGTSTKANEEKERSVAASDISKKSESQTEVIDIDAVDIEKLASTQTPSQSQSVTSEPPTQSQQGQSLQQTPTPNGQITTAVEETPVPAGKSIFASGPPKFIGGYSIDVPFEASKLPLDVAIFNSARAAGGDDRIRKYLQAVLIVGGCALTPGMAHALESRLQAIATPLVPDMGKVQIIPPPKDVDPRMLIWKGAAVLGKMDAVSDLWLTAADWQLFGMRGLKERCFYL